MTQWRDRIASRRFGRLLLVVALILLVAARDAMFPFILALTLAYILYPLVAFFGAGLRRLFPRFRRARAVAILFKYLYLRLGDEPLDPKLAMASIADAPMQLDV